MGNLPFENIKRTIIVRRAAKSDKKFGGNPKKRTIKDLLEYGIVNLNKPSGPTSHQVSAYLQKILNINKAGHSGTLDPKVCGVLPTALGRGTRIVHTLLTAGKEYVCLLRLHKDLDEAVIRKGLMSFVGKIKQLPPVRSAIKRQWRYRKIYSIEILEIKGKDVLFIVDCQAGTYIRKLCTDVAQKLGTKGQMQELVRTKVGPFKRKDVVTLQDVRDALWYYENEDNETFLRHCIRPIEEAVEHLPRVWVLDTAVSSVSHGMNLAAPGISKVESDIQVGETAAILSLKGELVATGETKMISREMCKEKSGIAIVVKKVFMKTGVYPRVQE